MHTHSNCTDPTCTSHHAGGIPAARRPEMPIPHDHALLIDEARRRLISRLTDTEMTSPPENLSMSVREIDAPPGTFETELHHIQIIYAKDHLIHRTRITRHLQAKFGPEIEPLKTDDRTWQYDIGGLPYQLDFNALGGLHAELQAAAPHAVEQSQIQGLFLMGLFISEADAHGLESLRLCGDTER